MKKIVFLMLSIFLVSIGYAKNPSLIGDWIPTNISENCYFTDEDVSFFDDGTFITHLQARPAETGTWKINKKKLYLTNAEDEPFVISTWKITNKFFTFKSTTGESCKFKRI